MTAPKASTAPSKAIAPPETVIGIPTALGGPPRAPRTGWDLIITWAGPDRHTVGCSCGWQQQLPHQATHQQAQTAWQQHLDQRTH